jgi:hypothetical protein
MDSVQTCCILKTKEKIYQCWYDEITALSVFLFHLLHLSPQWVTAKGKFEEASVNTSRLSEKK